MTTCSFCGRPGVYVAAESDAGGILSRTHSDATPCPGPGTRVTEAELLEAEARIARPDSIARLVAEIRRYRALLLGLATEDGRLRNPLHSGQLDSRCFFCRAIFDGQHAEGCPWPELEAEVQALRAERLR